MDDLPCRLSMPELKEAAGEGPLGVNTAGVPGVNGVRGVTGDMRSSCETTLLCVETDDRELRR